ncbi:MAG: hypothetical protein WBA74_16695 [Cyclobacteriaceae bacterium]
MRKLFLFSIVLLLSAGTLIAQDDVGADSGGGPESGDVLIEITGTPFEGSSLLNFGAFRTRLFVSDKIVPRLGLTYSVNNTQTSPDVATNFSQYSVMPGVELHLTNEGAFRSYAALDIVIGQRFASLESINGPSVDGSTQIPTVDNQTLRTTSRGYFQIGGNLSLGAEYHFGSRFYIGTEIGFNYVRTMYSDVSVDGELYQEGTSANSGSLNTTNTFRIGFKLL